MPDFIHKRERVRELIASAGGELQDLPPYSPDLNKIEHDWFPSKNRVRKSIMFYGGLS